MNNERCRQLHRAIILEDGVGSDLLERNYNERRLIVDPHVDG
jgi:hypothetical protein